MEDLKQLLFFCAYDLDSSLTLIFDVKGWRSNGTPTPLLAETSVTHQKVGSPE